MQLTELSNLHIASKALTLYDAGYLRISSKNHIEAVVVRCVEWAGKRG